jgi:GTP-binding protein
MRPTIAIVGRPNVGKSSLFNRLVGQPIAIVDPTPGVTRDRLLHEVRRDGFRFDIIDTGGIGIVDQAKLETDVYTQVDRAIGTADRILFLVDGREGITHLDREIANKLRPLKGKVIVAVNKIDHDKFEHEIHVFASLGLGDPLAVSAAQATGLHELLQRLCADLPLAVDDEAAQEEPDDGRIKICLAGRRNVGKSSLTNALCGEKRVIVADLPGTTRDAIDVPLDRSVGKFTLIDTAGLRKKGAMEDDIEFYAACRTERAIRRSHVILLVIDASEEFGMMDKKIAHFCEVEAKPTIVVVNKWDIAEAGGATREQYQTWLSDRLPGLRFAPVVFTCALTGYQVETLLKLARELHEETLQRVATHEVNELLEAAVARRRPKKIGAMPTKIYYGTQAAENPPTFIFFVNRTDWIEPNYPRFLESFLRERLPFKRIPLRILFKSRDSKFHEGLDEHRVVKGGTKADRNASLVINMRERKKTYLRRDDPRRKKGGDEVAEPLDDKDREQELG